MTPSPSADHPRSRGVYHRLAQDDPAGRGSSLLARGLRQGHGPGAHDRRIIPARAGFTRPLLVEEGECGDHPRSRGVYRPLMADHLDSPGSSPLARGLQAGRNRGAVRGGIIPARAGFTGAAADSTVPAEDHPRSRGVYARRTGRRRIYFGSSPLARGLPDHGAAGLYRARIIPARAGFTFHAAAVHSSVPDHPRSRGVYGRPVLHDLDGRGSSPLARGLPHIDVDTVRGPRIIPARAGFTGWFRTYGTEPGDHPRSRGVYRR